MEKLKSVIYTASADNPELQELLTEIDDCDECFQSDHENKLFAYNVFIEYWKYELVNNDNAKQALVSLMLAEILEF